MFRGELVIRLKKAQTVCKLYNHTSSGITVEGDIPWYVQFRVSKGSIADAANFDLGELWDPMRCRCGTFWMIHLTV